jgi:hypothetical protein
MATILSGIGLVTGIAGSVASSQQAKAAAKQASEQAKADAINRPEVIKVALIGAGIGIGLLVLWMILRD